MALVVGALMVSNVEGPSRSAGSEGGGRVGRGAMGGEEVHGRGYEDRWTAAV